MNLRTVQRLARGVQVALLVVAASVTFINIRAQGREDPDEYRFRSIEERLRTIESVHPDALVEAVRAQGKAIETQQTLLWGVLGAVLINVATSNLQLSRRRREGEDDSQRHSG